MKKIKKISGNYIDVLRKTGISESFAEPGTDARDTIQKDLPRSPFVDVNGYTTVDMRETWENPLVSDAYAQGNMNASFFSLINLSYILDRVPEHKQETLLLGKKDLSFAYYDDEGTPCGLSIVYNESDPSLWSATIIRNTPVAPEDREVTLFCSSDLIEHPGDNQLENCEVSADILSSIHSRSIQQLVRSIVSSEGQANIDELNKLQKRIKSNHNLDDRDVRELQLNELIDHGKKYLPNDLLFNQYIEQIRQRKVNDMDFFEYESFQPTLVDINVQFELAIQRQPSSLLPNNERALDDIGLTLRAILLELRAYNLPDYAETMKCNSIAESLRRERDAIHDLGHDEVVTEASSGLDDEIETTITPDSSSDESLSPASSDINDEIKSIEYRASNLKDFYLIAQYNKNIGIFKKQLEKLKLEGKYFELYQKGVDVSTEIEVIAGAEPSALSTEDLLELNQVLNCCITTIDEPRNTENIDKLERLSQTVSGKSSSLWKALGAALIVFVSAALVVAGLLGVLPTGGLSLLLVATGVVALTAVGVGSIKHGTEQGLAASVSGFFKASIARNQDDGAVDELKPNDDEINPNL